MGPWRLKLEPAFAQSAAQWAYAVTSLLTAVGLKAIQHASSFSATSQGEGMSNSVTVIESDAGSPGPLTVLLGLASLQALGYAFSRLDLLRLPNASPDKPWFSDDLLYEIFSYLDPEDAAQAGLVCTRWHRNAAHASYREVNLHTSSRLSRSLARTLLHNPDLRRHVRHLTVVHCMPFPQDHLYEWVHLLPPRSLRTCRILAVPATTESLVAARAVDTARTEIACFGYKYPRDVLLRNIAQADNPARRRVLQEMLRFGWMLGKVQGYHDHMEAVSPRRAFPDAIERFLDGIQLNVRSPALIEVTAGLADVVGGPIARERVDGVLDALGKYIAAASMFSVSLMYKFRPVSKVGANERSRSRSGTTAGKVDTDAIAASLQPFAQSQCLCVSGSPSGDVGYPPDAALTGCVGATSARLTVAAAKAVVDRVWRDTMTDGRTVRVVNLHFAHSGPTDLAEPCAACGLSLVTMYYLPRFVQVLRPSGDTR